MWTHWYDFDRSYPTFDDLRRRMDRLMSDLEPARTAASLPAGFPRVDLQDTEAAYLLVADVPGLNAEDVQLHLHEGVLTLQGRRVDQVPEGYTVHRQERPRLAFERRFRVPGRVAGEGIQATVQDGVLTVRLPKAQDARPRQIPIETVD